MNKETKDHFEVLRKVQKKPVISQREMAKELGFSLGKLNYCLRALRDKGLVKLKTIRFRMLCSLHRKILCKNVVFSVRH